jgi:uncharacterized protein
VLSRRAVPPAGRTRTVPWDGRTLDRWAGQLDGAEAVVNLAGRSIACVHTPENRREILASRLESVRVIEAAVARSRPAPSVLVQASAIGIYGDSGDRICDEAAPPGSDFTAEVVAAWEAAFFAGAEAAGPRRVALRSGFILGRDGSGLPRLAGLTRKFLGGAAGNGRQYMSWLHVEDFCAICRWAISRRETRGVYNATAPRPSTNAEFMRLLRETLGRPWSPPAPAWLVKLIARFVMRVEPSLVLAGCRCIPRRLQVEGFDFRHPDLRPALRDLIGPA